MNEPLDPPDDYTPDKPDDSEEVAKLKGDVAALMELLSATTGWLVVLKRALVRSPFRDDEFEEVTKLQDRIDRELNQ